MAINKYKAAASAVIGIYRLLLFVFIMGTLYYGKSLLIPLALAALFTFLLSPIVTFLERKLPRVIAIMTVVIMFFISIGIAGYLLTNELVEFSANLPNYKVNIDNRLNSFNIPQDSAFNGVFDTLGKIKDHLPGQSTQPATHSPSKIPTVNVIESTSSSDITATIKSIIGSLLEFLGSTGLVILLVIFMLFAREDMRGRFIRLIGPRRISATTRALDDAGEGVAYYLIIQLVLNVLFGIVIAIGLYFIGVPNALLWGGLAAVLRFIPYIGIIIAAIFPAIVALAIAPNWAMSLLTLALFILLDLVTGNFIEPLVASTKTGISSLALIVSAVFWTLLWGPIGLLLSTPLTVCVIVMGRHIPNLGFLHILLSNEEALALYEECYQRLLAQEIPEVMTLVNNYLKTNSLTSLYDSIFIPMLSAAEVDHREDVLDDEQLAVFNQNVQDILDDLRYRPLVAATAPEPAPEKESVPDYNIICIPSTADRDELAGTMLTQILSGLKYSVKNISNKLDNEKIAEYIEKGNYDAMIISIVAPHSITQSRRTCAYLHERFPQLKIIVGFWGTSEMNSTAEVRLQTSGADSLAITLTQATEQLEKLRLMKQKIPNNQTP